MQLLPSFVEMIHLRIVVDDLNRHQRRRFFRKLTVMVIAHMAFWPGKLKTKKEKE
jgi:hypothetical protein